MRPLVAVLGAVALAVAACGGDDDADGGEPARPLVADVVPALAAVEAELGGPQRYFEVNATPQVVNVFVAGADGVTVTPYVYVGGEVASPGPPSTAEGHTFDASGVAFDPDTVLEGVTGELPDSDVVLFTVLGGPGGAVQLSARVQSDEGGALDVVLGPDGTVRSVDPVAD